MPLLRKVFGTEDYFLIDTLDEDRANAASTLFGLDIEYDFKQFDRPFPETDEEIEAVEKDIISIDIELPKRLESTFAEIYNLKRKNDKKYGVIKEYEIGDIVHWRGNNPCIGRIKGKGDNIDCHPDSWKINDKTHNSLHYNNLRHATAKEIEMLGDKDLILL